MAKALTKVNGGADDAIPLTTRNSVPFRLAINHSLENNYNFKHKKLNPAKLKELNAFIDKAIGQSISDAEALFKRETDTNDKYGLEKKQILHFEVGKKFRIHGYYSGGFFVLCRLDPDHKVHN